LLLWCGFLSLSGMPGRTIHRRAHARRRDALPADVRHWREWVIPLVLLGLTVVVLGSVCSNQFVTWDDYENVVKNPYLNPPTAQSLLRFWAGPYLMMYIPLTYSVWDVLAAMAQVDPPNPSGIWLTPEVFHVANLLVHLIAVMAAYALLKRLTRRPWAAFAGALLFAIHPVQVEPVAWVTGMKDVLCGALSMIALWQYVRFAGGGGVESSSSPNPRAQLHYAAATAAFVLALLSKPSAVTVPLMAILIDRFLLRRYLRDIAKSIAPWLVLSAGCAIAATIFQSPGVASDPGPLWARPLLAADALAFYLYKAIFPVWLAVQYYHSPRVVMEHHWLYFTWIAPVALAVLAWIYRKRAPWLMVAGGLMLAGVLPVLGLVPFQFERLSLVADRFLYVAMLGPALALAFVLASATARPGKVAAAVCALWLLALGIDSNLQTRYWRDTSALFHHELAVNPRSAVAYTALSERALAANQPRQAEDFARQSIRLNRNQWEAWLALASASDAQRKFPQALDACRQAFAIDPDNPLVLNDLASQLARRGELTEAAALCRRCIAIDPTSSKAHFTLAILLGQQRNFPEALKEARAAVNLAPMDPAAQSLLASLLVHVGQRQEAFEHYSAALRIDPNFPLARRGIVGLGQRAP
jgi:protein O-mannosyl-transferase